NCLTCFCKAAPAYKETFWLEAPPRIFERRASELRRQSLAIAPNLPPGDVKHPLVMLVEDDEEIQAVMQRVCANLGYGSVSASNGQDGLELARTYHPNLILTDAFLPKLDGREMCRLLKNDPAFAATKMVVMTGLYTDSQFKSDAVKRFRIDDFLTKPVSITDLINLLQRHLEGAMFLPAQENLHELHRKEFDTGAEQGESVYEVACSTCGDMFDAVKAAWCDHSANGGNTLVCEHCGNCFCKAPEYRERFWANAPALLFEMKMINSAREVRPEPNPPADRVRRPLIMLLENDEATQLLVRTVASTLGYGFIVSENAGDARAAGAAYKPDLVLVDAWLPNADGRAICRELKEDGGRARTIVMTGRYADPDYRKEAQSQFNVDDCLAKPLAAGDVLQLVKKHLPKEVQAK
ncbi:MAG: response regulator, partial [Thermoanaerobaculia bacterium]